MTLITTEILHIVPTTAWPWMIGGVTIILGIVAIHPEAGNRIITFLQRIKDLFSSSQHPRRKVRQSSHVNKEKEDE